MDDEPSLLLTYRLLLERERYEVVACGTSLEAMAAIQNQKFDAVLCDYFLEEQHTGFEVVSAARQFDADVPAAVLTGYATRETIEEAANRRITIMSKPVGIPIFLATVSTMLKKTRRPESGKG